MSVTIEVTLSLISVYAELSPRSPRPVTTCDLNLRMRGAVYFGLQRFFVARP